MLPEHPTVRRGQVPRRCFALAWCLCLAAVAGCAIGPDFRPPQAQVPAQWAGPTTAPATQPAQAWAQDLAQWWTAFHDPKLTWLVEQAAQSNLDLKQAEARIRQARAARGIAAAGLGPTLDAGSSFRRSSSAAASTGGRGGGGGRTYANQYQAGFDAAWELDVFGGVRRNVEAADADIRAAVESRRDLLVTLAAEVARNYVDLRAFQQRIAIARDNLKAQEHTAELTRKRSRGGFASGLDVANAEAQVAATAAGIPLLESSAQQAIYGLGVLLGRQPAALLADLSAPSAIPGAVPAVPAGLPSDLLRRRPDIRWAEADIHAATARIGVATADLFPRFTISGSLSFQASDLSSWLNWANRFWSFGPSVTWRAFDTGRILSNIELQKALQDQSVIAYRQTVLAALQEVENALIASAKEQEHRKHLVEAVAANRKAVELATKLYAEGQSDFLNVLDAQRSLYSFEDALVQSTGTMATNLVALYKALGGGWSDEPQPAKP